MNKGLNELSIVLPVFNEADIIENVIKNIHHSLAALISDIEIIAVNDGSTDGTLNLLNQIKLPHLRVISHPQNLGYGGALTSGIRAARKSWVLLMDSDGQFHIDSLTDIWDRRAEHDVLLGYRKKRMDGLYRLMMGKIGNTLANILLGRHIYDINCGFKLFKKELIQPLPLFSKGGIINFEILYRIKNNHYLKILQFPIEHYPRKLGKSTGGNFKVIYKILTEGIRILRNK